MTWSDVDDRWRSRLRELAALIPPGSSVLDIGAGAQGLRTVLGPSCPYTPADIAPRSYDSLVMDMDDPSTWPRGRWDVAVMAGVLEYSRDPAIVLVRLHDIARRVLMTYAHRLHRSAGILSIDDLAVLAEGAGWSVQQAGRWRGQTIWDLS